MTNAQHDAAVQCLTQPQRFVRLVLQREYRGPLEAPLSPHSPAVLNALSPSGYLTNRPGIYIQFVIHFKINAQLYNFIDYFS